MNPNFTGNPIKTTLTPTAMWGKVGANGRIRISLQLTHGDQRVRTAPIDLLGNRPAFAGRETPSDRSCALAQGGGAGVVRDSRSTATVVDSTDGDRDAALGGGAGCAAGFGSSRTAFVQATVLRQSGTLSDGQTRTASAAVGSLQGAVDGRGSRSSRRRATNRGLVTRAMAGGMRSRKRGVLEHRRSTRTLVSNTTSIFSI